MGVVARIETPDRSRYGIIRSVVLDGAVSGYPSAVRPTLHYICITVIPAKAGIQNPLQSPITRSGPRLLPG